MEKIYISACLLGQKVRYDGRTLPVTHHLLTQWQAEGRLVTFCPEVAGGLPTPRPPAEIVAFQAQRKVIDNNGKDVSPAFVSGAEQALQLCWQHSIKLAIMAEGSPSCGSNQIYDGSHSGKKIAGEGLTVALLREHGIKVFNQNEIDKAENYLKQIG